MPRCGRPPGIGDDGAAGHVEADVPGDTQAAVNLMNRADGGKAPENGRCVIRGAVVDDDDLIVGVIEREHRIQALVESPRAIVGADDHGHARRCPQEFGRRSLEHLAEGVVRGLWRAVRAGDAERPIRNPGAAGVPVVGPGKNERPHQPHQDGLAHVVGEKRRLLQFAVAPGVHANFAKKQRFVADKILEAEEVTAEDLGVVKVHVKGDEVEKGQV
jgi:hypothetical protein